MNDDPAGWLPPHGIRLTTEEVAALMRALRAALDGTDELEPNRSHVVSIANVILEAIRREEGET